MYIGGVKPVEGGSGQRGVSGHAAESAGCSSRPGAEVEPLDSPARPPTALVARDDAIPAWAIVRRRSVILSGKKDGKPYVREDFTDSLVSILESVKEKNVCSFGPLARNAEWFLRLILDVAKDKVLSAASLKVRGCTFYVSSVLRPSPLSTVIYPQCSHCASTGGNLYRSTH